MTFIIDASVALKWYVEEEDSETARKLLQDTSRLEAPDLIIPEVTNFVWKKWRQHEFTQVQAESTVSSIMRLFETIHSSKTLSGHALNLSLTLDHPAYDCFYLACAEIRGAILVTADMKLHDKVKSSQFGDIVSSLDDLL